MLDTTRVERELAEARLHAGRHGLLDDLDWNLDKLANFGRTGHTRCTLYRDGAPYSFGFSIEALGEDGTWRHWFDGGLLYHGPHDGHGSGAPPTFAVTLTPTHGWSIHT